MITIHSLSQAFNQFVSLSLVADVSAGVDGIKLLLREAGFLGSVSGESFLDFRRNGRSNRKMCSLRLESVLCAKILKFKLSFGLFVLTTSGVYYGNLVAIVIGVRIGPLNFKSLLFGSLVPDFSLFLSLDLIARFIPEKKGLK